jgi:hypothetical protein
MYYWHFELSSISTFDVGTAIFIGVRIASHNIFRVEFSTPETTNSRSAFAINRVDLTTVTL